MSVVATDSNVNRKGKKIVTFVHTAARVLSSKWPEIRHSGPISPPKNANVYTKKGKMSSVASQLETEAPEEQRAGLLLLTLPLRGCLES